MSFDTKSYITDLIIQLNLNNMDDATRARLEDLKKKGVATKDQAAWVPSKEPPKINDVDTDTGTYRYTGTTVGPGVAAPDAASSLEELYSKLVLILRDVSQDKNLMDDDKVKGFVDTFYGAGKAIEPYAVAPVTGSINIGDYIRANVRMFAAKFGVKESDLDKLQNALRATPPTYTTDSKLLGIFDKVLLGIYNWDDNGGRNPLPTPIPTELGTGAYDTTILDIRDQINTPIPPTNAQKVQLGNNVNKLFGKLVANDKLRDKILSKDNDGDLTRWINKGLSKSNYKDGDNALSPKYEDRKNKFEKAKDEIKKFYVDTAGKLNEKHTRHVYSTNARYIVEGLIKKGVKPTDGTKKILETLDTIKGSLPNPVQGQLKWMKETLSKLSGTKFFEQALEDGDQMRQLVQEVVKSAVHDGKMEEAMVTLETLAVMRYTLTTSSVRDKLRKAEFTILSDPKLSFNKGPLKHITTALDKTMHVAMLGAFEIGNFAKNAIKEHGVKFGSGTKRLDKRTTGSVEYSDADKKAQMETLFAFWDFVNSSANSKDYNIFKKHSQVQKDADNKTTGTVTNTLTGETINDPTEQRKRFLEYLNANNIGRA